MFAPESRLLAQIQRSIVWGSFLQISLGVL